MDGLAWEDAVAGFGWGMEFGILLARVLLGVWVGSLLVESCGWRALQRRREMQSKVFIPFAYAMAQSHWKRHLRVMAGSLAEEEESGCECYATHLIQSVGTDALEARTVMCEATQKKLCF